MPYPTDPASLSGDELDRWSRRSPQEIEDEKQAAEAERHRAYFGPESSPSQPGYLPRGDWKGQADSESDTLWVADGSGGYRAIRTGVPDYEVALGPPPMVPDGLPQNAAAPE